MTRGASGTSAARRLVEPVAFIETMKRGRRVRATAADHRGRGSCAERRTVLGCSGSSRVLPNFVSRTMSSPAPRSTSPSSRRSPRRPACRSPPGGRSASGRSPPGAGVAEGRVASSSSGDLCARSRCRGWSDAAAPPACSAAPRRPGRSPAGRRRSRAPPRGGRRARAAPRPAASPRRAPSSVGDRLGAAFLEVVEESAQEPLDLHQLVAEGAANGQVVGERCAQPAHRTASGQGRAMRAQALAGRPWRRSPSSRSAVAQELADLRQRGAARAAPRSPRCGAGDGRGPCRARPPGGVLDDGRDAARGSAPGAGAMTLMKTAGPSASAGRPSRR